MDGIYRKGRYKELINTLNRIQLVESSDSDQDKYAILQEEVNKIIESLRNRGDQTNAQIHYVLLIVPLAIAIVCHAYIFQEYLFNTLVAGLVFAFLAFAHYRMNVVIRMSQEYSKHHGSITGDAKEFIKTKMNYLEKAIDIKKSRLLLISFFYILFFPIFLIRLHTLAISATAFDSPMTALFVAYLIGGSLWYFYYNRSFEVYDEIDASLNLIRENL